MGAEASDNRSIFGIASSLGVPIDISQTRVKPMVGTELETRGVRRGTRYYVAGEAPPDEEADDTCAKGQGLAES
jgi:hypothetical protein